MPVLVVPFLVVPLLVMHLRENLAAVGARRPAPAPCAWQAQPLPRSRGLVRATCGFLPTASPWLVPICPVILVF